MGWSLSILPKVLPDILAVLNGNLPPCSKGYVLCSNEYKLFTFLRHGLWAAVPNTPTLLENNFVPPNRDWSPFQQFFGKGKQSILTLLQKFGGICTTTYQDNSHQATLANHDTLGTWFCQRSSSWYLLYVQP